MATDNDAITCLQHKPNDLFSKIIDFLLRKFQILQQIYDRVSSELPKDIRSKNVNEEGEEKLFNYDEGHAGRYTAPRYAEQGATISFQAVNNGGDAKYSKKSLAFFPSIEEEEYPNKEILIFTPGLNTLHEPSEGETTTPQRLIHYTRVLLCIPMCQIHTGTSFDQGDIEVDLSNKFMLRNLLRLVFRFAISKDGNAPYLADDNRTLIFSARSIDTIQTGLSSVNLIDTPLKTAFRNLLASTYDRDDDDTKKICIAAYSRASVELQAALVQHVKESREIQKEPENQCFNRLRKYVTILTVGSAAKNYPDGPAYVHLASWQDALAMSRGVSGNNSEEGGADAVFLNFDSPFNENTGDNHNFGAVSGQYLSLILHVNKAKSIREIWEKSHSNNLELPPNLEKTLPAVISVTGGLDWLWNREEALQNVPEERFPTRGEAEEILNGNIGVSYVAKINEVQSTLELIN